MKCIFKSMLLLIAIVLILVLVSCNVPDPLPTATVTPDWTNTPIPPTATSTPTPTATATPLPAYIDIDPEDLKGVNITLRYRLDGKARDTLEELIHQYNEENSLGITVLPKRAYSIDELSEMITGDNEKSTDILIADSAFLRSINTSKNKLMELSDFLNDDSLSFDASGINPIMPVMLETENQNGEFFALPIWTSPAFLFYNKTWAIELGYPDSPTDIASFAEQACAAGRANYQEKDNGKHGTGGWVISSDPEDVMSWLLIFADKHSTPGKMLQTNDGDVFTDAASWLKNLYDNGCIWNSRVKEPYDYFAKRYALFYSGTYSDAERQYNAFEQSENYSFDNWDLIPYPVKSSDAENDPRIFADVYSIAVIKGNEAKRTNAAWQFIRWLYQDTHAAELAIAAKGWAVQDNDDVTKLYRNSGEDKLYQTLSYRQYQVNNDADENWITDKLVFSDGFAYIFNPSALPENIPEIWNQIGTVINEINSLNHISETPQTNNSIEKE